MKKLILTCLSIFLILTTTACVRDRASILFNKYPITEKNIYDNSTVFQANSRIYYLILMPEKVESRYLYIQIIKKDNKYGQFGYNLIQTRNIRHDHTGAIVDNIGQFRRKREFFQQNIHGNGASLSFRLGLSIETKNTSICNFTGESCFCQGEGGLPFQRPPPLPAGSPAVFFLQSVRAQASCRCSPKKTKTPPMDSHGRHFVHSVKKRVTGALYIR